MIRQLGRDELCEAARLIRLSFHTVADEFGFTEENAPRFTAFVVSEERLQRQYDEGRPMFGWFEDGEMVGFYSLAVLGNARLELNNLAVHPQYRHRQIGRQLVAHAVSEATRLGCGSIEIGIVEENVRLRKWYEELGFIHTGTKKFDFFPFTCGYMEMHI